MFEKSREVVADPEKIARWNSVLADVEQLKDKLGKGVDENIKESVASFLVNELPTSQSCGGHLERRFGKMRKIAPYIGVALKEPKERFVAEAQIKKEIADRFTTASGDSKENEDAEKAYWDYISAHHIQETPEYQKVRAKNEELRKKVAELIAEFYSRRTSEEARLLRIVDVGPSGGFRVGAAQGRVGEISEQDLEKYRSDLLKEQAERMALTAFLKSKFFEK